MATLSAKRIWTSRYTLQPRQSSLGAHAASGERAGSLIKIEFADGSMGYADVHPWTELGDASLSQQLESLRAGKPLALAARSLALASLDADARLRGMSAFAELRFPESHFLLTSITDFNAASLETEITEASKSGFKTAKIKVGKNLEAEARLLESHFANSGLRLRLDFNSSVTPAAAEKFLLGFSEDLNDAIEFCEDVTAWESATWRKIARATGVDLFRDRGSEAHFASADDALAGLVIKPAVQDPGMLRGSELKVVVTSYLDHPIGQLGAILEAGRLSKRMKVETCGLLSHTAYEKNSYSERFPSHGPKFNPILSQSGIGFGAMLDKEEWQPLL